MYLPGTKQHETIFARSLVGGPLSHKQGGLIHQLGVWLGRDLKNGLLLLLYNRRLSQ
jgi:hypothetical protein